MSIIRQSGIPGEDYPETTKRKEETHLYLRVVLSKQDLKLKKYPEKEKNLVTTTYNSQVKAFLETPENKTISKVVRSKKDVDNLARVALQRTRTSRGNQMSSSINLLSEKRQLENSPNLTPNYEPKLFTGW